MGQCERFVAIISVLDLSPLTKQEDSVAYSGHTESIHWPGQFCRGDLLPVFRAGFQHLGGVKFYVPCIPTDHHKNLVIMPLDNSFVIYYIASLTCRPPVMNVAQPWPRLPWFRLAMSLTQPSFPYLETLVRVSQPPVMTTSSPRGMLQASL